MSEKKTYKVEIIQNGHEYQQLSLEELQEKQTHGFYIAVQVGNALRMLQTITPQALERTPRIIMSRAIRGG